MEGLTIEKVQIKPPPIRINSNGKSTPSMEGTNKMLPLLVLRSLRFKYPVLKPETELHSISLAKWSSNDSTLFSNDCRCIFPAFFKGYQELLDHGLEFQLTVELFTLSSKRQVYRKPASMIVFTGHH